MESTVLVERRDGGILLIGINRPEANNRLDPPTYVALGQALYKLEHDDELRVGVLYATGPDFVPALDLAAYGAAAQAGTFPAATPRTDILDPLDMTPPRRSKPLVVAVQGQTKRVGHELFLAADVRVAASDTVFAQDEALLGLYPGGGATVRLVREIGHGNAMRLMLTGEAWSAAGGPALRTGPSRYPARAAAGTRAGARAQDRHGGAARDTRDHHGRAPLRTGG